MSALDTLARLRRFNEEVRDRDPHLAEESLETARLEVSEVAASGAPPQDETELESIVMRKQRPVLAIRDNDAVLDFRDLGDSTIWKARLEAAKTILHDATCAVGRIDLTGSSYDWVGTGWLIDENIVVTNRHVAVAFAKRDGGVLVFKTTAPPDPLVHRWISCGNSTVTRSWCSGWSGRCISGKRSRGRT